MAEKRINGNEYRTDMISAKQAYEFLADIMKLAGPGARHLPAILESATSEEPEQRFIADVAAMMACSAMITEHGCEAYVAFKERIIGLAMIKRPSGQYDVVDLASSSDVPGGIEGAEALFNWVMEAQFGNFSKGSGGNGPVALALVLVKNIFRLHK